MTITLDERRTARYRFYGVVGNPLYFGVAVDPEQRWLAHRHAEWWPLVDPDKTIVDWYDDRAEAMKAEKESIEAEQPAHNRDHADYLPSRGMPTTQLRANLADVLNGAINGQITYVTNNGRRVAAIVPVLIAEAADHDGSPRSSE